MFVLEIEVTTVGLIAVSTGIGVIVSLFITVSKLIYFEDIYRF